MKKIVTLASIVALGFAVSNVSNAANSDAQPVESLTVQYGDLDLNKPQGVDALLKRIKSAAKDVCSEFEGRTQREKQLHSQCVDQAVSTAVARVNRPALSQYLAERSSKEGKVSMPLVSSR